MSQIDLQWFSAEDEGKTEQPSEHKLRKARSEEGRVPKSQELNSNLVLFFLILLLIVLAPWIKNNLKEMLIFFFNNVTESDVASKRFFLIFLKYFLILTLPFCIFGAIIGVLGNLIQNKGFIFTTKLITPKFDQILPNIGKYLKRTLFSIEGAFNVVKSLLKVVVIAFLSYLIIRLNIETLLALNKSNDIETAVGQIGGLAARIMLFSSIFMVAIGVADYFVQRRQFMESMKMTKQEVKEEFKELEGDQEVKNRLETAQREMLQQNMPKAVREADVLITNPTHFAVALQWMQDKNDAPQVTAKGEDLTAQNMKRIAREADVPIVENKPLARGLYTDTKVGDIIPVTYIRAIATIYAQIGYMDKKNKKV